MSSKRKISEEGIIPPTSTKSFASSKVTKVKKPIHPFFDMFKNNKVSNGEVTENLLKWNLEGPDKSVLVGRTPEFDAKKFDKIVAFDLDSTLITTKGKHVFAKSENDWEWNFENVPAALKKIQESSIIVIFSNQAGLQQSKKDCEKKRKEFKLKLGYIYDKLKIPFIAYAATTKDYFRKPCIGMWELLEQEIGKEPNKEQAVFVGDAAGRSLEIKAKIDDHSDTDRKFALNLSLPFKTPEEYFLNQASEPYLLSGCNPPVLVKNYKEGLIKPPTFKPAEKEKLELILMVGPPGSGKTSFVKKYFIPFGYEWINNDTLKTKLKCLRLCEKNLESNKSVVIDNTNGDKNARKDYIAIAKKCGAFVRCLYMDVDNDLSIHNANFRSLRTPESIKIVQPIPSLVYRMWTKNHQKPEATEGIDLIEKIHFFPQQYLPDSNLKDSEKLAWEKDWSRYYN